MTCDADNCTDTATVAVRNPDHATVAYYCPNHLGQAWEDAVKASERNGGNATATRLGIGHDPPPPEQTTPLF